MGAQLRVYRRRIRSVQSTKKITRAMELIAASRIIKAQQRAQAAAPYARELTRAVSAVATFSNVDHALVSRIRREVGSRLQATQVSRRNDDQAELTGVAERQFARKLISDVIGEHAGQRMDGGEAPLDTAVEHQLAEAVYASMFAAGALQALLDDKSLEEIDINGCDEVWVTRAGAAFAEPAPPVARTVARAVSVSTRFFLRL